MNYALDAVWWKLQTRAVRDLAVLLTAPPPWLSECELSVATLLGEGGFRYLLALDAQPTPLHQFLQPHAPFGQCLGRYADYLLAFWLTHAPHSRLWAHNLPIDDTDDQILGEAGFIATLNGHLYHIELACLYCAGGVDDGCGLNQQDNLAIQRTRLQHQLILAKRPEFQDALCRMGVADAATCCSVSVLRGMLFLSPQSQSVLAPLNPYAWQGLWGAQWTELLAAIIHLGDVRFAVMDRLDGLAPQRLPEHATLDIQAIQALKQGMVAVLQPRMDGYWHEVKRLIKSV